VSVAVVFMLCYTVGDVFVLHNLSLMFLSGTFIGLVCIDEFRIVHSVHYTSISTI